MIFPRFRFHMPSPLLRQAIGGSVLVASTGCASAPPPPAPLPRQMTQTACDAGDAAACWDLMVEFHASREESRRLYEAMCARELRRSAPPPMPHRYANEHQACEVLRSELPRRSEEALDLSYRLCLRGEPVDAQACRDVEWALMDGVPAVSATRHEALLKAAVCRGEVDGTKCRLKEARYLANPNTHAAFDPNQGRGIATALCDKGVGEACDLLGDLVAAPPETKTGLLWTLGAARQLCSDKVAGGCEKKEALLAALEPWSRACTLGTGTACRKIGWMHLSDRAVPLALSNLETGCAEDASCIAQAGSILAAGGEYTKAETWLSRACSLGLPQACADAGRARLLHGLRLEGDQAAALTASCTAKHEASCRALAFATRKGLGVNADAGAAKQLESAAEKLRMEHSLFRPSKEKNGIDEAISTTAVFLPWLFLPAFLASVAPDKRWGFTDQPPRVP